jgi:hypothetical protein
MGRKAAADASAIEHVAVTLTQCDDVPRWRRAGFVELHMLSPRRTVAAEVRADHGEEVNSSTPPARADFEWAASSINGI